MTNDPLWQTFLTDLNAVTDWTTFLMWGGASPGYTLDGSSRKDLPADLGASFSAGGLGIQLLLASSLVCGDVSCNFPTECQSVSSESTCGS